MLHKMGGLYSAVSPEEGDSSQGYKMAGYDVWRMEWN